MTDSLDPDKPDSTNLRGKAIAGLSWSMPQLVIRTVIEVGTLVSLSWLLTPSEFGIPSIALSIIGVMTMFVELGVAPALIQRTSVEPQHLASAMLILLASGAAMILINLASAPYVAQLLDIPDLAAPMAVFSIVIILQPYVMVMDAYVRRSLRFRTLAVADIAGTFLGYSLISITAAVLGFGLWSLVMGQIGSLIIRGAILSYAAQIVWAWRTTKRHTRDLLDFGAFFSISRIADYLGQRFDRVIVGGLLGSDAAGLYQRVQNVLMLTYRQVSEPLDYVMFPLMSRIQDDPTRLWKSFRAGTGGTALLTMPMTVIAIVISPGLVPVIFGPNWTELVAPLQILLFATITRPSDRIASNLARATGKVKRLALLNAIYAVLVMVAVVVGSPFGLVGVASTVLGATMIKFLMTNQLARSILGIGFIQSLSPFVSGILVALCVASWALVLWLIAGHWLWTAWGAVTFLFPALLIWMVLLAAIPSSVLPTEIALLREQNLIPVARRLRARLVGGKD